MAARTVTDDGDEAAIHAARSGVRCGAQKRVSLSFRLWHRIITLRVWNATLVPAPAQERV